MYLVVQMKRWGGGCRLRIPQKGARFKQTRERIWKTWYQRIKNFTKNLIVFVLNNLIWTNRRGKTKIYFKKNHFIKKTKILLIKFLFRCFLVFLISYQEDRKIQVKNKKKMFRGARGATVCRAGLFVVFLISKTFNLKAFWFNWSIWWQG